MHAKHAKNRCDGIRRLMHIRYVHARPVNSGEHQGTSGCAGHTAKTRQRQQKGAVVSYLLLISPWKIGKVVR